MANVPGMYQLSDLLAVRNQSAASFGLDNILPTIQNEVAYANQRADEMMADFCQPFYEQSALWGGGGAVEMEVMDEHGNPMPSHSTPGIVAQFPISLHKQALGWNAEYFRRATPREVAMKFLECRKGYFRALTKGMRRAIYGYGNGVTSEYSFTDKLTNGVALTIKSLCNGGVTVGTIPDSPAGVAFANTHCHLNPDDGIDAAWYRTLYEHVTQHGNTKGLKCIISSTNLAALATFTTIFTPLSYALLNYAGSTSTIKKLDNGDVENQLVGYLDGNVEVWVKPWAVAEYAVVVATGESEKMLGYRQPAQEDLRGWRLQATFDDHPLHAEYASAEFGFGVFNRVMGAVCQDGAAWTVPGPAI
jgi:hypothetical protein